MADRPGMARALARRLPFFIVLAAGIWLWKGGGGWFPSEREIIWALPDNRATIRELDIQIADEKGMLVKREQVFFHAPPGPHVVERVRLSRGDYPAHIFVRRESKDAPALVSTTVHVGEDDLVLVSLPADAG